MPNRRKPHRAAVLCGGPEDGYVALVPEDIDELRITTVFQGSDLARHFYNRTNAFSGRRRIFQHVYIERIWPAKAGEATDPRATG